MSTGKDLSHPSSLTPHVSFMSRALELARQAWGETHPNPMVGAVITEQGRIVAEGWHRASGQAHAEVDVLRRLGRKPASDATLYVTLEPCSTHGRTGACTTAIMQAGIRKVVVGATDPNPGHAGNGFEKLRNGGVEVITGVLERECTDLNLIFNHWIVHRQPLMAMKLALTLDGKFAAASGHSRWVTGEAARADVMRWRRYFPAIAVGADTVLNDDPALTSRIGASVWCPRRFVLDRSLKTVERDPLPKLYTDAFSERTTVVCSETAVTAESLDKLSALGVTFWQLPEVDGHLDMGAFRQRCADDSVYGVYIEAGPTLASVLLAQKFIDYAYIYKAPKFINDSEAPGMGLARATESMDAAICLTDVRHAFLEDDSLIRGHVNSI